MPPEAYRKGPLEANRLKAVGLDRADGAKTGTDGNRCELVFESCDVWANRGKPLVEKASATYDCSLPPMWGTESRIRGVIE